MDISSEYVALLVGRRVCGDEVHPSQLICLRRSLRKCDMPAVNWIKRSAK